MKWPLDVYTDSTGACSFQWNSCARSQLRGCFDRRSDWIEEMRDQGVISAIHIDKEKNMADIHTKCLSTKEFIRQRDSILKCQNSGVVPTLGVL